MGLVQNVKLPFAGWTFQLDFALPSNETWTVDYEIDGPNHDSGRNVAKDEWKDRLKAEQGMKVIHIGAELTQKKWWDYLDAAIPKALLSPSSAVYIFQ